MTIGKQAFGQVYKTSVLYIPDGVLFQSGGNYFSQSNFSAIYFGDNVTISDTSGYLFYQNTNLETVHLPENTSINIAGAEFYQASSMTELTIPKGTTAIGRVALQGMTALQTLTYNAANVTSIDSTVVSSSMSYDMILGADVDTLPTSFNYLASKAQSMNFIGPNAIYVSDGALADAPAPFTGISGWIYVDEYGAVYQLDTDNDTATLIYLPESYVDGNGETHALTEYTVPTSFTVSGESDSTVNADYNVTTVASNALKYADNLTAITFADVSKVTLEAYALANCETLKSITDSATSSTVTSKENAEKMSFASVGANAFYNTGLTTTTPALSEDTLSGSESISAEITGSSISVTVSSSSVAAWTPNVDDQGNVLTTGGYVALTGDEAKVSATVTNTSGSSQTYRLYLTSTDSDFTTNYKPGNTYPVSTSGSQSITVTCVQDPDDPYSYYLEFSLTAGQTISLDLTCEYPNGSDGGGLTVSCAIMETDGNGTVTGTQSGSENELQIWWTTEQDHYTLEKTDNGQSSVQIKTDENGVYLASGLVYKITLTQDEDKNSSKGEDYVTSVEYSDVITLPDGVTWDESVLEAIRNGTYTKSTGNTTTFSVNGTTIATLAMTADSGLSLRNAVLSVNADGQVVLTWTVKNTGSANLANNTFTLTVASAALDVTLESTNPNVKVFDENNSEVSNTVSSTVHYTFGEDATSTDSAVKTLTKKDGNIAVSKAATNTVTYLGEDLTYELSIYNDGVTDYTYSSGTDGSYTYYDKLPSAVYISASNMEKMFQEAIAMGTPLTVTITDAILGVNQSVTDADNSGNTAYLNPGNTSSTETTGNTITITCVRTGAEEPYTYTYSISVTDASGVEVSVATSSGTDLEALLQGIGYGVTSSAVYTCTWALDSHTSVTGDPSDQKKTLTIEAGETLTWSIYSTVKSTFQYLGTDWPAQYPKDSSVTVRNAAAYLADPDGKTIKNTGSVSTSVQREAVIGKTVYDSEGNLISSSHFSAEDGEALTYELTFKHYGDGSYDDLPMVDDLYGSQYLLVKVSDNNSNQSIADGLKAAGYVNGEWDGTGVITITIGDGADAVEYYVLGAGSYTDVVVGTYTKSDDGSSGTLIASNITVTTDDQETYLELGGTSYAYSGVHTEIDWYFDELDGGNYTITVDYQALVDYGDQPSYTLGNVVWMNDRTGSRIYDLLWGGGTLISYDKEIVTDRKDDTDPSKDVIDEDDQSEVGEGETVTYRLALWSTGDEGTTFTLSGANIADELPDTYGTFVWSKDNVSIVDVVVVTEDGVDPDKNKVTGYNSLTDDANWSIETIWDNNTQSDGQYYIIWNDDVSVTFTGRATVYIYVQLTFPKNGDTVTTTSGMTTDTAWDDYVAAAGGTTVNNTFYVYRNPATVTHLLKEEGSAKLTKGVYALAQRDKTAGSNITFYPSGSTRTNYNNEDSVYRYVWYYVEIYNDASSRLYINDLYDTLPEGFTYFMMASQGNVTGSDGILAFFSSTSNVNQTVSSGQTAENRYWLVEKQSGVTYMSATVTASASSDGTIVFSISGGDGGTYSIKYDEEMGQYYLDQGESIVFGYICQIDTYVNTEDNAVNTIAMSYTDYTNAGGVNVAEDHEVTGKDFKVDGGTATWYNGNSNDGSTEVKNSSQISYDDGTNNAYWLTSSVTVSRGEIVPGVSKSTVSYRYITGNDTSRKDYESSVNIDAVIYWEATFSNSGTMAIYDYTVTDVMPEPYVFTEEVTYAIVDSAGKTSSSGSLFLFPQVADLTALATGDTVTITYTTTSGATATADIIVGGSAVEIASANGTFSVELYMSAAGNKNSKGELDEGDVVLEIRFSDEVWSIPEGGYLVLDYASYNPSGSYANQTYINTVTLTPETQEFLYAQSGKITSDGTGVYATSSVTVSTGASTTSWKTVKEENGNTTASSEDEGSSIVLSSQDSTFTYTLYVENDSEYAMTNLVVIDNLPSEGDHLTYSTASRGSEYTVVLADDPNFTVTISSPTQITSSAVDLLYSPGDKDVDGNDVTSYIYQLKSSVYEEKAATDGTFYMVEYSTTTNEEYLDSSTHDHGDVTDTDMWTFATEYVKTSDLDTVTAFRLIIRDDEALVIPAHATVSISFNAKIKPTETTTTTTDPITGQETTTTVYEYPDPGEIAWNNFGYDYTMQITGVTSTWLSAMPLEVGVQVPSAPKLEKKLVDLDGNAYTATEDTEFTFIVYAGEELKDASNNNSSYESLDDLKKALDDAGIGYKEITVTVKEGESDSGYVNLGGSDWSDWTWTQGDTYTIAEFLTDSNGSNYTFKSWTAANGTSGDVANGRSYTFTYDQEKTLYLAATNTSSVWDIELTKVDKDSYDDGTETYTTALNGAVFALYSAEQGGIYQEVQNAISSGTLPAGTTTYETTEADNGTAGVDVPLTLTVGDGSSAVTWYLYAVQTTATVTQTGQTGQTETLEGYLSFSDLTAESYYLVEIQAPSGYNLDSTPQQLLREDTKDNSYALTVTNNPGAKLPKTGGAGRWAFTLAGAFLIGAAACLYLWRRRRARA